MNYVQKVLAAQGITKDDEGPRKKLSREQIRRGRARAAGQGAFFGWGDELSAALVSGVAGTGRLLRGEDPNYRGIYEDVRAAEEFQQQQYEAARPGEALAAEIAGGVVTGGGLLRAPAAAAARIPAWAQAAGAGAAAGGAYGAGTAAPGERLRGGAIGAGAGAVATPVMAGGLRIGGRVLSAAGRSLWRGISRTPENRARGMVREALRQSDITADDAVGMLRELGEEGMLFEVSEGTRALARAAYRDTPLARAIATRKLTERQAGMGDRIIKVVGKAAGGPEDYQALHSGIARTMRSKARPLYDKAYSYKLDVGGMTLQIPDRAAGARLIPLADFLKAPSSRAAMRRASKLAQDEFDAIDTNVKALDYMQRAFYDLARAKKPGTNEYRVLMNNRQAIIDALEKQVPEYGAARAIWRGGKAQEEAAKLGRSVFRGNQDEIVEAVTNMSAAELQAMRAGVLRAVVDKVKSTPETGNALRTIIGKQRNRELLDLVFPDGEFDKILPKLAGEQAKYRSFSDVLQGSRTAMVQGESLIGDDLMNIVGQSHDMPSAIVKILKKYGFGDASGETLAELSKMLFRRPEERWLRATMKPPRKVLAPTVSPKRAAGTAAGGVGPLSGLVTE